MRRPPRRKPAIKLDRQQRKAVTAVHAAAAAAGLFSRTGAWTLTDCEAEALRSEIEAVLDLAHGEQMRSRNHRRLATALAHLS